MSAKSTLPDQSSLLVDLPEASRLLGVSTKHCWTLARRGVLPSVRLGRRRLFARNSLRDFIETQLEAQSGA